MSSFTCVERRFVNIGRECTLCRPISLCMSNPCRYCLLSVTLVRSVPVFNWTWRWVLPPHPLVVCVVTNVTLDISAACCCCTASSSLVNGCIRHSGFISGFLRISCSLITGTRRSLSSCSNERTSARSLWGGMALIWSRVTALWGLSSGGTSSSMFRQSSIAHSRIRVVASESGSLPSFTSLHRKRHIVVAPSSNQSRRVSLHASAIFAGIPMLRRVIARRSGKRPFHRHSLPIWIHARMSCFVFSVMGCVCTQRAQSGMLPGSYILVAPSLSKANI